MELRSDITILVQIQKHIGTKKGDICRLFCAYVLNNILSNARVFLTYQLQPIAP